MAKNILTSMGSFCFYGVLIDNELKVSENNPNAKQLVITLRDEQGDSEIKLNTWVNSDATYYDLTSKSNVTVSDDIESKLKEVRATGTGIVRTIVNNTKNASIPEFFTTEQFYTYINKLPKNKKFNVKIEGDMSFREYNNRVYRDFTIKSIEFSPEKELMKLGFTTNFIGVISESIKDKFIYNDYSSEVPILVRTRLQDKQYGFRPLMITLDKDYLVNRTCVTACKQLKVDPLEFINTKLIPVTMNSHINTKGYVATKFSCILKVGQIEKKPTLDDIPMMERMVLEMQGEEAIKDRLSTMKIISEYNDINYLSGIDAKCSSVNESDLNLINSSTSSDSNNMGNSMLDMLNSFKEEQTTDKETIENKSSSEDLASKDELESLVNDYEKENKVETVESSEEVEDDDSFPF